jgi:hypothetical protein
MRKQLRSALRTINNFTLTRHSRIVTSSHTPYIARLCCTSQCATSAGRASHHSFRDDETPPVGPSAVTIPGHHHDKVTTHCS